MIRLEFFLNRLIKGIVFRGIVIDHDDLNVLMEADGIQEPLQERRRVVIRNVDGNQRIVIHCDISFSDS